MKTGKEAATEYFSMSDRDTENDHYYYAKGFDARDEEVRKLVEVLEELTNAFANSNSAKTIQDKINKAKEAIKPYIK